MQSSPWKISLLKTLSQMLPPCPQQYSLPGIRWPSLPGLCKAWRNALKDNQKHYPEIQLYTHLTIALVLLTVIIGILEVSLWELCITFWQGLSSTFGLHSNKVAATRSFYTHSSFISCAPRKVPNKAIIYLCISKEYSNSSFAWDMGN